MPPPRREPVRDRAGARTAETESGGLVRRHLPLVAVATLALLFVYGFPYIARAALLAFAGVLLAIVFRIPSEWLAERTPLSPRWALALVVFATILLVAAGVTAFGYQVVSQADQIMRSISDAMESLQESLGGSPAGRALMNALSFGTGATTSGALLGGAHRLFAILVVLFVGIYVGASPDAYEEALVRLVPPAQRARARSTLAVVGGTLRWWLAGQIITMAVIGILSIVGLWMVGAPFPFGLGALAGLLAFIPYIGATLALIAATLLAAVKSASLALAVFAVYVGIHVIEGYLLAPLVQKRMVYLPPALTITSQFLLWMLAGTLGLVVATPLTAASLALTKKLYIEETLGGPEP